MKRLLDDLIGDVGAIKVAGVDVIYAGCNCLSKYSDGCVCVAGWSPDVRTGELHGAVAHAVHGDRGAGEREGASEIVLFCHAVSPMACSWLGGIGLTCDEMKQASVRSSHLPQRAQIMLEPRKSPVQARSAASVDAILEGTVQVLREVGKERLTTTGGASRGGVWVGTLLK